VSALLGGAIMAGLLWVWLDHRRRRLAAIIRAAEIQAAATVRAAEIQAQALIEQARVQHPTSAPAPTSLRSLAEKQKN
jgi:hypothetical protein